MSEETKENRPSDLLNGYWRIKFLRDNNCEISGRLVPVKKDQVADVAKHIAQHLIEHEVAEKVAGD